MVYTKNQSPNLQSFSSSGYSSQSLSEIDTNYNYYLTNANCIRTSTPTATYMTSRSTLTTTTASMPKYQNDDSLIDDYENPRNHYNTHTKLPEPSTTMKKHQIKKSKNKSSIDRLNESLSKLKIKHFLFNIFIKCINIFQCLNSNQSEKSEKFPKKSQNPVIYDVEEIYDNYNPNTVGDLYYNSIYENENENKQIEQEKLPIRRAYQLCANDTYAFTNCFSNGNLTDDGCLSIKKFPNFMNRNSTMINPNSLPTITPSGSFSATTATEFYDNNNNNAAFINSNKNLFQTTVATQNATTQAIPDEFDLLSQYSNTSSITTLTRVSNNLIDTNRQCYYKSSTMKNLKSNDQAPNASSFKYIDDDCYDSILFNSSSHNHNAIKKLKTPRRYSNDTVEYPILKFIQDDYLCDKEVEGYFDNPTYYDCYASNSIQTSIPSLVVSNANKIETYC